MRGIVADTVGQVICLGLLEVMEDDTRKENYYKLPLTIRDLLDELGVRYKHGGAVKNVVDKFLRSQTGATPRNMGDIAKLKDMRHWPRP